MAASEIPLPPRLQRYEVDQCLQLWNDQLGEDQLWEDQLHHFDPSILVYVMRLRSPRTLSSDLVVKVVDAPNYIGTCFFLKLYDRRFADQLRKDHKIASWNKDVEKSCLEFVRSGKEGEFLQRVHNHRDSEVPERQNWTDAENEAFLGHKLHEIYENEKALYGVLQEYQGQCFPRFFAGENRKLRPNDVSPLSMSSKLYQIKGLLLQYFRGFNLTAMTDYAPSWAWQDIVNQAIRIAHILSDKNILNGDVRLENYMVVPRVDGSCQVFMVNLAQCRLRREDESYWIWGVAKCRENEEGFIGETMKRKLGELDFSLDFKHSGRYSKFVE